MGRRSDHTASELRELLIARGHELMAERGFSKFSGREAARRAGYTVGTIYNVFGGLDGYLIAINSQTFRLWVKWLETALAQAPQDPDSRVEALVRAYFEFAETNRNTWMAIYDHRIDPAIKIPHEDEVARKALTGIVDREVSTALGLEESEPSRRLVRSLIATVHGHCVLWLTGSYALMKEDNPADQALARVLEVMASHAPIAMVR